MEIWRQKKTMYVILVVNIWQNGGKWSEMMAIHWCLRFKSSQLGSVRCGDRQKFNVYKKRNVVINDLIIVVDDVSLHTFLRRKKKQTHTHTHEKVQFLRNWTHKTHSIYLYVGPHLIAINKTKNQTVPVFDLRVSSFFFLHVINLPFLFLVLLLLVKWMNLLFATSKRVHRTLLFIQ